MPTRNRPHESNGRADCSGGSEKSKNTRSRAQQSASSTPRRRQSNSPLGSCESCERNAEAPGPGRVARAPPDRVREPGEKTGVLATLRRETSHAKAQRRQAAKEEVVFGESTLRGTTQPSPFVSVPLRLRDLAPLHGTPLLKTMPHSLGSASALGFLDGLAIAAWRHWRSQWHTTGRRWLNPRRQTPPSTCPA